MRDYLLAVKYSGVGTTIQLLRSMLKLVSRTKGLVHQMEVLISGRRGLVPALLELVTGLVVSVMLALVCG